VKGIVLQDKEHYEYCRPIIGIVVPLANEQDTVNEFLRRVLAQLCPNDMVLCVLDNVSIDNTRLLVEQYSAIDPRVILVWAPKNQSVVDAYFSGYRAALKRGCEWILEMDGGLSHLPEEIPRFTDAMQTGVDFVAGSRFTQGGKIKIPLARYVLSKGGTLLSNLLLRTHMRDMTSGFECFTKQALSYIVGRGVLSNAHFFQTEIRYMMHCWSWIEVPITYSMPSNRVGRSSIVDALKTLWQLYRQAYKERKKQQPV
jgi:dolichol-phosphate mannosyltransferase